jgi:hypothetical protein
MFSCTTARWHQWKDLPAEVGLVVSNAVGIDRVPPLDGMLLQDHWHLRHHHARVGAIRLHRTDSCGRNSCGRKWPYDYAAVTYVSQAGLPARRERTHGPTAERPADAQHLTMS